MKSLLGLATQQAAENMQIHHNFFTNRLRWLSRTINQILAPAKIAVLLLPILFLSLFITPAAPAYAQTATLTPRQIVEYALTLEKLEADFYRRAVDAAQNGGLASAPQVAKDVIVSFGEDEARHVDDLSAVLRTLGGNPDTVTLPANPNYNAILGRNPFANPQDFLLAGQYVEDLGVAAYKGQAPNLLAAGAAAKPLLAAALEIHSVEARHAAGIRFLRENLLGADVRPWIRSQSEVIYNENRSGSPIPFSSQAFDGYATRDEVLALVRPILSTTSQTNTRTNTPSTPRSTPPRPVRALW
ncbi:MAG: ferritin-like domain-containing protein [Aphanothece sp. CMT-3BRIN-NPC111]|jgi:hypothetical protein|nr:ferritin-like domain-containing protein [Aphanothece sp. CMT-3BRIN-NPC111]